MCLIIKAKGTKLRVVEMKKKPEINDTCEEEENDLLTARRMFLRKHTLAVPLILAAFTTSGPAYAQGTCVPDICDPVNPCSPGFPCNPDSPCNPMCGPSACGPDICKPARP
jgi:hypothetical protein